MANTTFDRPDLSAFTRLDDLGLEVMGQSVGGERTVLACKVVGEDRWCRQCGGEGVVRDTVIRRPAHEPYGWRHTILHVSVRRYRCPQRAHVWRQALALGGALGADGRGRSSSDGGTHLPGPGCVLEEPPTPLSWVKASVY